MILNLRLNTSFVSKLIVQSEEERYIHLQMRTFHDILFYKLENPYKPEAAKPKGKKHGYGLQNVRKCVEKYHGDMSIEQDSCIY